MFVLAAGELASFDAFEGDLAMGVVDTLGFESDTVDDDVDVDDVVLPID